MIRAFTILVGLILITSIHSFCQTTIHGNFTTDTHLGPNGNPADSVYLIIGDMFVYGTDGPDNITTLTIEAGVILEFSSTDKPSLDIGHQSEPGQIIAQGTASNKIIFTTNSSSPSHGRWGEIALNEHSKNCILEHVDMLYGGDDWGTTMACLSIYNPDGSNLTISDCNISYSEMHGVYIDGLEFDVNFNNVNINNCREHGIYQENSGDNAIISYTNCNISDNDGYGIYFDNSPNTTVISNCVFADNGDNAIRCYANQVGGIASNNLFQYETLIEVIGIIISDDAYWSNFSTSYEVNYLITDGIWVKGTDGPDSITTLEIEEGTKLLFEGPYNSGLDVGNSSGTPGQLIAIGTPSNRIIFTSAEENPEPGDWTSLGFGATSKNCALDYVDILYGGDGNIDPSSLAILSEDSSDLNISNCNIMYSESNGIKIYRPKCDINFANNNISHNLLNGSFHKFTDSNTTISYTNCEISNNGLAGLSTHNVEDIHISECNFINNNTWPIECYADQIKDIESNNTFQNENSIYVFAGWVTKDATWHNFYTPYNVRYHFKNDMGVAGYDGPDSITTLIIEPGTRLVFKNSGYQELKVGSVYYGPGQLIAQGNAANRIVFTSAADNPSPGDWQGLVLSDHSKNCILDYVDIFYAGNDDSDLDGSLVMGEPLTPHLSITNSRIAHSATNGIYMKNPPDSLLFNNNTISDNSEHGLYVNSADDFMANCTHNNFYDNGEYGVFNNDDDWIDARYCYWGSNDGPGGVGPGSGDEVSDYVLFDSWLTSPFPVYVSEIPEAESFISIYPNPATNHIHINSLAKDGFLYTVTIYNSKAQSIYQEEIAINNAIISLSNINAGAHFIVIQNNTGRKVHSQVLLIK